MKTVVNISVAGEEPRYPLLNLDFRPFFLLAGLSAIVLILIWFLVYVFQLEIPLTTINIHQWHAHEMIYGFSMAVIAGFMLTATKNWTGQQTLHGVPLLGLALLWLFARLSFSAGLILPATVLDLTFILLLATAVVLPILRSKRYQHLAVATKLAFFFLFNLCFYLGALGYYQQGTFIGIYGGFYLLIGLILMIGRRVVPFFIERGLGLTEPLNNNKKLDIASLIVFLLFFVAEITQFQPKVAAFSALAVGLINGVRLVWWYRPAIWQKPLLWSLYLAMWNITLGFFLIFLTYAIDLPLYAALHMFAFAGVGLVTLSMMARVSLGHTGRSIHEPPEAMALAFKLLLIGMVFRVILCAAIPAYYVWWIAIAMVCWLAAFGIFVYQYYPILKNKRVDGQVG